MPYLKDRPLVLLRCPNGEGKECFFQKHVDTDDEGILGHSVFSKLKNKNEKVLSIDSMLGLLELVQLGTIEIHTRGCLREKIDYPNQIVFDFAPDSGVSFEKGKIFLDYLINSFGASAIAPYSVRAHSHAPVAIPITWAEVKKLKCPNLHTILDVPKLLKKRTDPWKGYNRLKQKITMLDKFNKQNK